MPVDRAELPYEVLAKMSSRIVIEVPGINCLARDTTSKLPATMRGGEKIQ